MDEFLLPAISLVLITCMIFIPLQQLSVKTQREDTRDLRKISLRITAAGWVLITNSKNDFHNYYVQQLSKNSTIPRNVIHLMDKNDFFEGATIKRWIQENNDEKLLKKANPFWYHLPSSLAVEFDSQMVYDIKSAELLLHTEKALKNVLEIFEKNNMVKKNIPTMDAEESSENESGNESGNESENESSGGESGNESIDSDF